jgi:type IV secretion system protein VirD4
LFIRGERPIMDFKYDILKHPNVALTTDGKAKPYLHGGTENAIASIILEDSIDNYDFTNIEEIANVSEEYEIISSEDIDEYFK